MYSAQLFKKKSMIIILRMHIIIRCVEGGCRCTAIPCSPAITYNSLTLMDYYFSHKLIPPHLRGFLVILHFDGQVFG